MKRDEKKDAREIAGMARNIIALYLDAPEFTQAVGARWYKEEHSRCADWALRWDIPLENAACAAAAISPGMRWDLVFAALGALRLNPKHKVPTYSREFVRRAVACLDGAADPFAIISGPKVTAFARLLARPYGDDVVVDGHAWNVAQGTAYVWRRTETYDPPAATRVTPRRHRLAVAAYRLAAEELGLYPHQVQATTWVHWKQLLEGKAS